PDRFVHLQAHEPAEQDVVVELLHQQPLTPNRVEQLQQLRTQEALGRNRRAAVLRIERIELARHLPQDLIDKRANGAEGMILGNALLGGHIAEHCTRLTVVSSHARYGSTRSQICRSPTKRFSATSYLSPDSHLMVVSYTVDANTFRANPPQKWSEQPIKERPTA